MESRPTESLSTESHSTESYSTEEDVFVIQGEQDVLVSLNLELEGTIAARMRLSLGWALVDSCAHLTGATG